MAQLQSYTLGLVDSPEYAFENNYTVTLLQEVFKKNNTNYQLTQFKSDLKSVQKCLQNGTCTFILDKEVLITNDTSRILYLEGLKDPIITLQKPFYKQLQEQVILTIIQWTFGIMCPIIVMAAYFALFPCWPKRSKDKAKQHQKYHASRFLNDTYSYFVQTFNGQLSDNNPLLGIASQLLMFLALVYLIMLVAFDVSKILLRNQGIANLNQVGTLMQSDADLSVCADIQLQTLINANYMINLKRLQYSSNVASCIDQVDLTIGNAYDMAYNTKGFDFTDYSISILTQYQGLGLVFVSISQYQSFTQLVQQLDQRAILFQKILGQSQSYLTLTSSGNEELITPYLPVHYTGYALDGFFILLILISALIIKYCLQKPKFIQYDDNKQVDQDIATQKSSSKGTKDSPEEQGHGNLDLKIAGDSIKLGQKGRSELEFVREGGRPDNFLGLQDVSSGDQEQKFKYGCTDELEEALSSVHPANSITQNRQMFTGSEEMEDLKGYLKSGNVLQSKLQKLSTLKNAVRSLEKVPGKSISEQPIEVENEEEDDPMYVQNEDDLVEKYDMENGRI